MPRLIDYRCRNAFLQQAAFEIVSDRGVAGLSRPALAEVLGTSAQTVRRVIAADVPLVLLAAREADERRRARQWIPARPDPAALLDRLVAMLPDTPDRRDEERVWSHLRGWLRSSSAADRSSTDSLAARFQLAERGWVDPQAQQQPPRTRPWATPALTGARQQVAEIVAGYDSHLANVCEAVVEDLHRAGPGLTSADLALIVRGAVTEISLDRLTVEQAESALDRLLIGGGVLDGSDGVTRVSG